MTLSLIILFMIILIVIVIYNNQQQKENFNCNIKNIDTYIEDPYLKSIRNYLDNLNKDITIYTLKGNCNIDNYNEYDIEPRLKQKIINLILPFINKLNKELSIKIEITKLLNIDIETDKEGNQRYIIDLFTYETIHFYSCRFIIDLIVFNTKDKEIHLNRFVLSNAKLNNTQHLSGTDIHNLTTNLVETPLNRLKDNCNLLGYDNSNLEFTTYNNTENNNDIKIDRIGLKSKYRNPWILPINSPLKCNFPCQKQANGWDEDGVLYNCNNDDLSCIGINTSATPKPFYPYINPTITGIPANQNNYQDLFSLTRGIIKPLSHT